MFTTHTRFVRAGHPQSPNIYNYLTGAVGSIPIFPKYYVVGASCSLDIRRGQDARTTPPLISDAGKMPALPLP